VFDDDVSLSFRLGRSSPYSFRCRRCGVCCNNKRIAPDPAERARMAAFLGVSPGSFASEFLDPATGELNLKPEGDCVFLEPDGCRIHPARPSVCRLFPLGWIRTGTGEVIFGIMPRHPDCQGWLGADGTVEEDLAAQGALDLLDRSET